MMRGLIAVVLGMQLLAGCFLRPGAPEARAELFIETLINTPQAQDELAIIAELPPQTGAEALVEGVAARAGLKYLQARARLGARIRVDASDSRLTGDQQQVNVNAREGYTGGEVVRFHVHLARRDDEWRVTQVTSE